jgi:hypothetical protein
MKKTLAIGLLGLGLLLASCTEQSRARNWGGEEEIMLEPNEKLINMSWKGDDLWVLTIDTTTNIQYFRESSSWGMWEGSVIIK